MISLERCETLKGRGKKRISEADMTKETWNIDDWLDSSNVWAEDT